jgi:predicted kinase
MQKMIIVRGMPGSGKSTLAKILAVANNAEHIETDQMRYVDGVYTFDADKSESQRAQCEAHACDAAGEGLSVVVSNPFLRLVDYEPYTQIAEVHNMSVQIIHVHGEFGSIHDVPDWRLDEMRREFEPLPVNK